MPFTTGPQSKTPSNKLYTNTSAIQSSITDIYLSPMNWVTDPTILPGLMTPGGVILRDMGKTSYATRNIVDGKGLPSTLVRKIQLVPQANQGKNPPSESNEYYTGYIPLGTQTVGSSGFPNGVIRLN